MNGWRERVVVGGDKVTAFDGVGLKPEYLYRGLWRPGTNSLLGHLYPG
jgi:hypothetical protein